MCAVCACAAYGLCLLLCLLPPCECLQCCWWRVQHFGLRLLLGLTPVRVVRVLDQVSAVGMPAYKYVLTASLRMASCLHACSTVKGGGVCTWKPCVLADSVGSQTMAHMGIMLHSRLVRPLVSCSIAPEFYYKEKCWVSRASIFIQCCGRQGWQLHHPGLASLLVCTA